MRQKTFKVILIVVITVGIGLLLLPNNAKENMRGEVDSFDRSDDSTFIYPVFFESPIFHTISKGYFDQHIEVFHPVNASYYALYSYDAWKNSGFTNEIFKEEFLSASKAILENLHFTKNTNGDEIAVLLYNFDWDYAGEKIQAPWVSGMAQGMAISVLLREYNISNTPETLRGLNAIVNSLITESKYLNDLVKKGENLFWIEEYPGLISKGLEQKSSVLNGGLLASVGLLEYSEYFTDENMEYYVKMTEDYLVNYLSKYNFDGNEPSYGLLDYRMLPSKKHFINFENTESNSDIKSLPIYEVSINLIDKDFNDDYKQLRVMRTTGGSKAYEFESFIKNTEFNFLLSSDGGEYVDENFEIVNIKLKDSSGNIVGVTKASDNYFYGVHWSDPYVKEGNVVRSYYPGKDPYQGANETGHFKVVLDESLKDTDNLYVEIEYIMDTNAPVNLYMYNQGRFNLGFFDEQERNSSNVEKKKFYLPRANDFSSYSFYHGWSNVETIDGRRSQRFNQVKDSSLWNGGWLQFKFNEDDLQFLNEKSLIEAKVTYFDSNDETTFVNLYNGVNRHLGILHNTGSKEWKEETFYVPIEYLINEGSSSPKTKIVIDTLKYLSEKFDNASFYNSSEYWTEKSLYNSDMTNFILYQKSDNSNLYEFEFSENEIYIPGITDNRWEFINERYSLNLTGNSFAYFNVPKDIVEDLEIIINSSNGNDDKLFLAQLDREKSTIINIGEFSGEERKIVKLKDILMKEN
jgi:hypothetical protein